MLTGATSGVSGRVLTTKAAWMAGVASAGVLAAGAANAQQTPDPRSVVLVPTITVQGLYTDNVDQSAQDRKSAFVTRGQLGLNAQVNTVRLAADIDAQVAYDAYSNNSSANGVSWEGFGSAVLRIVDQLLTFEADGSMVNGNVSTTGDSAVDRSGIEGRTRISTISGGPRLSTKLGDFADFNAVARLHYVDFATADGSTDIGTPRDGTVFDAGVGVDTANRFAGFQLAALAQYQESDTDFKVQNAIGSAYVRVAPNVRIIGRGGYEEITQPGTAGRIPLDLKAPIWSAGVELTIGARSKITVEGGRRYHRNVWSGQADVQILERLSLLAAYTEAYETQQISIISSFVDFLGRTKSLNADLYQASFNVSGDLLDETTYKKSAVLGLAYAWPTQRLEIHGAWEDRELLRTGDHNRDVTITGLYTRTIRPDLEFRLGLEYARAYESLTFGKSRKYGADALITYSISPTLDASLGYFYQKTTYPVGAFEDFTENAGVIILRKRFE